MSIVGPLPVTLANGTVNDATQVMTDLNWIVSQINANGMPSIIAGNLSMNGFKLTNLAAGTTSGDSVNYTQFNNQSVASITSELLIAGNGPWANPAVGDTQHLLEIVNDNTTYQCMAMNAYGATTSGNNFHFNRYYGTLASPTVLPSGAFVMSMGFRGWDGSGTLSQSYAAYQVLTTENWSSTAHGMKFHWEITKSGGGNPTRLPALDLYAGSNDGAILQLGDGSALTSRFINNSTTGAMQVHGSSDQGGAQSLWFGTGNATYPNQTWHRADVISFQDRSGNETFNVNLLNQQILVTGKGGFGYYAGAGSAVAQLTSKSTGVSSSTPSTKITMNSGVLSAGTAASFTFTNAKIGADDHVIVTIRGGATAAAYVAQADSISSGSCRISLSNISSGALGEAVVLQVSVFKGASS